MIIGKFIGLAILFCLIGYLFGNILFGLIISKIKKVNLRKIGSGNVGATNSLRAFGKKIGFLVMLFDLFKAWLSVFISLIIYKFATINFLDNSNLHLYNQNGFIIYLSGLFAIIGHCFPIFYIYALIKSKGDFEYAKSYSGGKGAASAAGLFIAISPWLFIIAFILFFLIVLTTRYVSLSSMLAITLTSFLTLIPWLDYFYMLNMIDCNIIINFPNVNKAYEIGNIINYSNNFQYLIFNFIILILSSSVVVYRHKSNIIKLKNKNESKIF